MVFWNDMWSNDILNLINFIADKLLFISSPFQIIPTFIPIFHRLNHDLSIKLFIFLIYLELDN